MRAFLWGLGLFIILNPDFVNGTRRDPGRSRKGKENFFFFTPEQVVMSFILGFPLDRALHLGQNE